MIVQCAACQARFKIADDKVTERGVKVRCSKCSTTFVVRKDPAQPAAPAPADIPRGGTLAPQPLPSTRSGSTVKMPAMAPPPPPPPAPAAPPKPAPGPEADPFADLSFGADSPPSPTATGTDPFAGLDLGLGAPPPPEQPASIAVPDLLGVSSAPAPRKTPLPGAREAAGAAFGGSGVKLGGAAADPFAMPSSRPPAGRRESPRPAPAPSAAASDPFAGLGADPAPRSPGAASQRISSDPFAGLAPGKSAEASEAASALTPSSDPFAGLAPLGTKPPAGPAAARSLTPTNDPFARASAAPAAQPVADPFASKGKPDPFAGIDLGLGAPAAKPAAPPAEKQAAKDPFSGLDFGGALGDSKPSDPFAGRAAPAQQKDPFAGLGAPAAQPKPAAAADPFADLKLDLGATSPAKSAPPDAPAVKDPFAAAPAAPAPKAEPKPEPPANPGGIPSFGKELDLDSSDPSGLELDVGTPKDAKPAPKEEEAKPQLAASPAPAKPRAASLDSLPETTPTPKPRARATTSGEQSAVPKPVRPAAKAAFRLPRKPSSAARSLAASLAIAALSLAAMAWAGREAGLLPGGPQRGELAPYDVTNGLYQTETGHSVFFVRGRIRNESADAVGPIRVSVDLVGSWGAARHAEILAGRVASPEELFLASDPAKLTELNSRLDSEAAILAPGASADFLAVFYEYPDELSELEVVVAAKAAPGSRPRGPAKGGRAAPKPSAPEAEPAAQATKAPAESPAATTP